MVVKDESPVLGSIPANILNTTDQKSMDSIILYSDSIDLVYSLSNHDHYRNPERQIHMKIA